jgi:hypothetical protein
MRRLEEIFERTKAIHPDTKVCAPTISKPNAGARTRPFRWVGHAAMARIGEAISEATRRCFGDGIAIANNRPSSRGLGRRAGIDR